MAKITCNFISYTLRRAVDLTVIIPSATIPESMGLGFSVGEKPNYEHLQENKLPLLYLLHGYGNNHATWTGYTNVELYAEERNIAVVMISGENKSYVDHDDSDLFFEFIENELPDFICNMFPVSKKTEDTYLAGLSMGAFGSLVHSMTDPEKYAAVGAFSGAVTLDRGLMVGALQNDSELNALEAAKKSIAGGKKLPPMYISCGTEDHGYQSNRNFVEAFAGLGVEVTWAEEKGYGHEWRFWDHQIEAFLDWLPRKDVYASKEKRRV